MQQRLSVYIGERSERVGTLVYDPARPSIPVLLRRLLVIATKWICCVSGAAVAIPMVFS